MVKDYQNFLNLMKELKTYFIKFNKDGIIKSKVYLFNCAVKNANWQPVIIIIYNKVFYL